MAEPYFIPITRLADEDGYSYFKVSVNGKEMNITPTAIIYEKIIYDHNIPEHNAELYDSQGEGIYKRNAKLNGQTLFILHGNKNQMFKYVTSNFGDDKFFINNHPTNYEEPTQGGRKRKRSTRKIPSKKRSIKSRRGRNSRKRNYSRRK